MLKRYRPSRLTRSCVAALLGVSGWSVSPLALAQAAAPPAAATLPGQKPPCVPASAYMLGYDCELFPLPTAAVAPVAVVPVAVVPVAVPVAVAVVPAAEVPVVPATEVPAPPAAPDGEPAAVAVTPAPVVETSPTSGDAPSHAPAYVAFAVGVAGIGMTVAFGILALQTKSTLNGECGSGNVCPAAASSDVSSLKTDDNLADVGLGIAVAGVAVGAILFATEHRSSPTTGGLHVEPFLGLGAGGFKGSF